MIVSGRYEAESDFIFVKVSAAVDSFTGLYQLRFIEGSQTDSIGDVLLDVTDVGIANDVVSLQSSLESGEDVDVYRIPNALPGSLLVTGIEGIRVDVFDQHGRLLDKGTTDIQLGNRADFGRYEEVDTKFLFLRVSSLGESGDYEGNVLFEGQPRDIPGFDPVDPSSALLQPDSSLGDDQHSDRIDDATRLGLNQSILVSNIDSVDDVDLFKIRVSGISDVTVTLQSDDITDLELVVLDANNNPLTPDITLESELAFVFLHENIAGDQSAANEQIVDIYVQVSAQQAGQYTLYHSNRSTSRGTHNVRTGLGQEASDAIRNLHVYDVSDLSAAFGTDQHGETFESATPIALSELPTEVTSFIDGPADADAFRFTAIHSDVLISLMQRNAIPEGTNFDVRVFEANGDPVASEETWEGDFFVSKRVDLDVGSEYYAIVSGDDAKFGRYVFYAQPIYDILATTDLDSANDISFDADGKASVSGTISDAQPFDLYRIRGNHPSLRISGFYDEGTRYRVVSGTDGSALTPSTDLSSNARLPGAVDNQDHDVYLLVWNRRGGDYRLDLDLDARSPVDPTDVDGDNLETASDLDTSNTNVADLQLNSGDDVDVFRFTASGTLLHLLIRGENQTDESVVHIDADLLDVDGEEIAGRLLDNGAFPESLRNQYEYDLVPGDEYFIRVANGTENPISASMHVRQLAATDGDLHGDTPELATMVTVLPGLHGISGTEGRLTPGDADVFEIVSATPADQGRNLLIINVRELPTNVLDDPDLKFQVEITDQDGNVILDDSKDLISATINVTDEWRYFVRVSSNADEPLDYFLGTVWLTDE